MLWFELCSIKFICSSCNTPYLRVWQYLDIESLKRKLSWNEIMRVGLTPVWPMPWQEEKIKTQTREEGRPRGDTGTATVDKPGREAAEETSPAGTWTSDFQPPNLCESKFSCVRQPGCGAFMRQPWWAKTMPIRMGIKNKRLDKIANHRTLTVWFHLGKKLKKKDICRLGTQVHSDTDTPDSYTDTP